MRVFHHQGHGSRIESPLRWNRIRVIHSVRASAFPGPKIFQWNCFLKFSFLTDSYGLLDEIFRPWNISSCSPRKMKTDEALKSPWTECSLYWNIGNSLILWTKSWNEFHGAAALNRWTSRLWCIWSGFAPDMPFVLNRPGKMTTKFRIYCENCLSGRLELVLLTNRI